MFLRRTVRNEVTSRAAELALQAIRAGEVAHSERSERARPIEVRIRPDPSFILIHPKERYLNHQDLIHSFSAGVPIEVSMNRLSRMLHLLAGATIQRLFGSTEALARTPVLRLSSNCRR